MANWITHMMIADRAYAQFPELDRVGFCIGNVAPDCNIENEDWSAFTPPREVTHWMGGERKAETDCERFYQECIAGRRFGSNEERSFYLGYYSHLLTDACFQKFTRDEARVRDMMVRIRKHPRMSARMNGLPYEYDAVKRAFSKKERLYDVAQIEYEYICSNPQSAYMTVLRTTKNFPEYISFFPKGAIVRKLGVMAVPPEKVEDAEFVFISRKEYADFLEETYANVFGKLNDREEIKCVY